MRKTTVIIALSALMLGTAAAQAGDGGTWSGYYAGAEFGYSWGKDNTREFVTSGGAPTGFFRKYNSDGWLGGIFGGYNWQSSGYVIGVEADISVAGIDGGYSTTQAEYDWMGALRLKAGVPLFNDKVLAYAAGGVAIGNIEHTYISGLDPSEKFSEIDAGWTVGAGLEYTVSEHVSLRTEYRYSDFGTSRNVSMTSYPGYSYTHEPRFHTVFAGVIYHF